MRDAWGFNLLVGTVLAAITIACPMAAVARPIADDTLTPSERSQVTERSPIDFEISGGARRGANLFHSFRNFDIEAGGSVYFGNPDGVRNILARVTGGNPSNILGTLGVRGNANLFLLNPSGILFGEGARLDVGGSFLATTANAFQFGTQGAFSATAPESPSPLLTIDPSAVLFSQLAARSDAAIASRAMLAVPANQSLLLVGGRVVLAGGQLQAPSGRVEIGGLVAPGSVELTHLDSGLSFQFPTNAVRSDISLTNGAEIDASAERGGNVAIQANRFVMHDGSQIDISGNGDRRIEIQANSVDLSGGVKLDSGNGEGNIFVTAAGLVALNDVELSSTAGQGGEGDAGDITIRAGSLSATEANFYANTSAFSRPNVSDGGKISFSITGAANFTRSDIEANVNYGNGEGRAGDILVQSDTLSLVETYVRANTNTGGSAGRVTLLVNGIATLTASQLESANRNGEQGGSGASGDLTIRAGSFFLLDGSQINASTEGGRDGVALVAGNVDMRIDDALFLSNSAIFSQTNGFADGGQIRIRAGSVSLTDRSEISASTSNQGDAGDIRVHAAEFVALSEGSAISSIVGNRAVGDGGVIDIRARSLTLNTGGQLNASVASREDRSDVGGQGRGGNITVNASESVLLSGVSPARNIESDRYNSEISPVGASSGIYTNTGRGAIGQGGSIQIETDRLRLNNRAVISAQTQNSSSGGNIQIMADTVAVTQGGQVLATTDGEGSAGRITINANRQISLSGSDPAFQQRRRQFGADVVANQGDRSGFFTSAAANTTGQGGAIRLTTGQLTLQNRAVIATNNRGTENAGSLQITAPLINLDNRASLTAETALGSGGSIRLRGLNTLTLNNRSQISTSTQDGAGGNLTINHSETPARSIQLRDRSRLAAQATRNGNSGNLVIRTRALSAQENSGIFASSNFGNGGSIVLHDLETLRMARSRISASTQTGQGGNLTIDAADTVQLQQRGGLFVQATEGGIAGNLTIRTGQLQVERSQINVSGRRGQAGSLAITADSVRLDRGRLSAEADVSVIDNGANITLQDLTLLFAQNGSQISATANRNANGGNVAIGADFVVAAPQENNDIIANAQRGSGGNIQINTQGIFGITPQSAFPANRSNDIDASSQFGVAGTVTITRPDADPSRGLVELPIEVVDASQQIDRTCPTGTDAANQLGEFIVSGRGGLPPNPTDLLDGDNVLTEWVTSSETTRSTDVTRSPIAPESFIEAQGWRTDADGRVVLVAQSPTVAPWRSPLCHPAHP